ncbi:lectin like domain-containing protein [Methanocella sp. MCL-LM]|uniref:lectin like domain-containing protein n=1 Tax=Methanocella sp. MCL-LM TaxID=3412035 RepID=UPI003C70D47B
MSHLPPALKTNSDCTPAKPPRRTGPGWPVLKVCALFIIAMMLAACFAPGLAGAQNTGHGKASKASVNPAFTEYKNSDKVSRSIVKTPEETTVGNSARSYGLKPHPVSMSHLSGKSLSKTMVSEPDKDVVATGPVSAGYPASYDLRTLSKVTGVRNQGSSGSCWAFATYASMESYLLPGETPDFSENNLKNTHGFDWGPNDGGNGFMSTAYLARWSGPVSEAADPYNPLSTTSSSLSPVKRVQDVYFLPARANSLDNDNIKAALMTYGAVYITYLADESPEYYDPVNASYYYPGFYWPNHAVAVVGWDDSYSRFNFPTTPAGDGAFIVKNSWGTAWGDEGYFYISYYDGVLGMDGGSGSFVFTADPLQEYDHVYQHDWYGLTENWGFGSDTAWFATEYTASGPQMLEAVGFYTAQPDSEYLVRVYRDGALAQTSSGTLGMPGYRTAQLDSSVRLEQGERFRIEVRLRTPGYNYPVPIEGRYDGYNSAARANASESFYSYDGVSWYDSALDYPWGASQDADVCLKAYTSDTNGIFGFSQQSYATGESGGAATITITRDAAHDQASVNYSAAPGTATARDFTPAAGTLDFDAGETSKTFLVPVTDDQALEGSEAVILTLSGATNNSQIEPGPATLTIVDDEAAPAAIPDLLAFAASEQDGTVSVIDAANNTVIARLDAGDGPRDVAVSPGGAYLYVTDNATDRLWKVDARNLSRLASVPVGSQPRGIAISPEGSLAAIAASGDDTIAVVDLREFAVLRTISAGLKPEAVAFSPDGSLIYAANNASGDLSVINAATWEVSTLGTGANPTSIGIAPDGRAYVANSGSNNITVFHADGTASEIALSGQPQGLAISPDGYYAYVSFPADNRIDVIGLWPADTVAQVSVNRPGRLALSRDGGTLYAGEAGGNNITVVRVPDGTIAGTIIAGNNTTGLAAGPVYQAPVIDFSGTAHTIDRSATNLTIALQRQGCLDLPETVTISVSGGNATAGVDYVTPAGTVQFAPGSASAQLNLSILPGTRGDRTLALTLSNPTAASIGSNATAWVTIKNPRVSYTVNLTRGWNLLSVPVTPENPDITSVIPPAVMADTKIVWVYDNGNPQSPWRFYKPARTVNSISNLTYGTGFWICMDNNTTLTFTGTIPEGQAVPIGKGWNLIGPASTTTRTPAELYGSYYITWGYENGQWYYYKPSRTVNTLPAIKPGYGYWVKRL